MQPGRIISGLMTLVYSVIAHFMWETEGWFFLTTYMVLPLGAIWFGREIGDFATLANLNAEEPDPLPGFIVVFMGWLLMVPPLIALIIYT
ncbi:MAG: hypothetical protein OEV42_17845 [Deltaproteobacteria bacterium]|nr:hypothetical protein [Deltaproteobacteria bacterium]